MTTTNNKYYYLFSCPITMIITILTTAVAIKYNHNVSHININKLIKKKIKLAMEIKT